jgi:hypothetical protein
MSISKQLKLASSIGIALSLISHVAEVKADDTCFELSRNGKWWSKTPEQVCVSSDVTPAKITFRIVEVGQPRDVAAFTLDLISRAKCIDCNKDVFAISNPSNSLFNDFRLVFSGKRDQDLNESGKLTIGNVKYFYRLKRAPVKPPSP